MKRFLKAIFVLALLLCLVVIVLTISAQTESGLRKSNGQTVTQHQQNLDGMLSDLQASVAEQRKLEVEQYRDTAALDACAALYTSEETEEVRAAVEEGKDAIKAYAYDDALTVSENQQALDALVAECAAAVEKIHQLQTAPTLVDAVVDYGADAVLEHGEEVLNAGEIVSKLHRLSNSEQALVCLAAAGFEEEVTDWMSKNTVSSAAVRLIEYCQNRYASMTEEEATARAEKLNEFFSTEDDKLVLRFVQGSTVKIVEFLRVQGTWVENVNT